MSRRDAALIVGRLQAHGEASYQFRERAELSYYLKLQTDRGVRTLWGKDLKRAIEAGVTRPQIGDHVGAQRIAREAVTITERQRDADGRVVSETQHLAHRARWRVEKIQFFAERARLARRARDAHADVRKTVREHPELKSTFISVRAAQEFAARRIANPEERERFLDMVRGVIDASIRQGDPLPEVRLRERPQKAPHPAPPARPARKDEPTR